jgi:hypothetical protein
LTALTSDRSSTDLGPVGIPLTVSAQLRLELDELIDEVDPKGRAWPLREVVAVGVFADDDDVLLGIDELKKRDSKYIVMKKILVNSDICFQKYI